jgi:hypothetical protein
MRNEIKPNSQVLTHLKVELGNTLEPLRSPVSSDRRFSNINNKNLFVKSNSPTLSSRTPKSNRESKIDKNHILEVRESLTLAKDEIKNESQNCNINNHLIMNSLKTTPHFSGENGFPNVIKERNSIHVGSFDKNSNQGENKVLKIENLSNINEVVVKDHDDSGLQEDSLFKKNNINFSENQINFSISNKDAIQFSPLLSRPGNSVQHDNERK